ncbi:Bet1-like SNARE 1-1 [Asimina triloba]
MILSDTDDTDKNPYPNPFQECIEYRLTGDIHEEVESHNRLLDRMGNDMDASRGTLSGTMDRFKMVISLGKRELKALGLEGCTKGLFGIALEM